MRPERFDVVILGGGNAGYVYAYPTFSSDNKHML
jgi:pyruvate/2-oxoglutarate dehydrogenase complex dihydrolipoamide dehydrogenase (E3) component